MGLKLQWVQGPAPGCSGEDGCCCCDQKAKHTQWSVQKTCMAEASKWNQKPVNTTQTEKTVVKNILGCM